jgi:hypothetical protein
MYKTLLKNAEFYDIKYPETIVPSPTDDDYTVGFIRRYFVRRSNDINGHIFEVSEKVYSEFVTNNSPFWIIDNMKWRITGPKSSVFDINGIVSDMGVVAANKLPNIKLYLPNLTQFHR